MSEYPVPVAKESPRNENGILKWYVGDTFEIDWTVQLVDEQGDFYTYDPEDHLVWSFYTVPGRSLVHKFDFTNIQRDTVTLSFTPEVSNKFTAGLYFYCVKLIDKHGEITTLCAENKVEVEKCH